MIEIIKEQPTQEKPVIVENYPYGYTQRTTKRYWVETTRNGQRFVGQTLNPKTGLWNAPKKSTYSQIILVGLDEKKHVTYTGLSLYSLTEAQRFKEQYESFLSEYQKNELMNIIKMSEVYDKIEYTIKARKFRNIITGDITESVDIMHLSEYEEVNDNGETLQPVDPDKEQRERNETNRKINSLAVLNASKETSIEKALKTFNRAK